MMVISNGNIYQLKNFVCFIKDELDFMIWIEKKSLTYEMKCLIKMNCKWKSLIKRVKLSGKKILNEFLKSCNDIMKSWATVINSCTELLNICEQIKWRN